MTKGRKVKKERNCAVDAVANFSSEGERFADVGHRLIGSLSDMLPLKEYQAYRRRQAGDEDKIAVLHCIAIRGQATFFFDMRSWGRVMLITNKNSLSPLLNRDR